MSQYYGDSQWPNANQHPPRPFYPTEEDSRGRQHDGQASDGPYQSHGTSEGGARPFVPRASTELAIVPRHTDAQPDIRQDNRPEVNQSAGQDSYYGFSNAGEEPAYHAYGGGPIYQPQPTSMASSSTAPYNQAHRPEGSQQRGSQGTRSEPSGQYHGSGSDYYPGSNREVRGVSQASTQPFAPYGTPGDGGRDVSEPNRAAQLPPGEAHCSLPHMRGAGYHQPHQPGPFHPLPTNAGLNALSHPPPQGLFQPPPYSGAPLSGPSQPSQRPRRPPDEAHYSPSQMEVASYPQSSQYHSPSSGPFHPLPTNDGLDAQSRPQPRGLFPPPSSRSSQPPRHSPDEYDLPATFPGHGHRSPGPDEDDTFQVRIKDARNWYAPVECKVDTGNETGHHLISMQMIGDLGYDSYAAPRVGPIDTLGGTAQTVGSICLRWRVEMDGTIHPREDWFEIFDRANFPYDVIFSPSGSGAGSLPGAAAAPNQKSLMMVVMDKDKKTQAGEVMREATEERRQKAEKDKQRQMGREESRRRREAWEERKLEAREIERRQRHEQWEREKQNRERAERRQQGDGWGGERQRYREPDREEEQPWQQQYMDWERENPPPQRPAPPRLQGHQQHQQRYQGQLSEQQQPQQPHPEWQRGQHDSRHYS